MDLTMKVRCQREPWRDGVELMVVVGRPNGGISVAEPLTMRNVEPGEHFGEPTMRLHNDEAQILIDELWRCGLRPSEGTGSAGSLAATERHLKDMQSIAMGLLRKDGVNA